jgi:hypothetical protein
VNRQVKQRLNIVNLLLKRPAIRKTPGWSFTIANAKGDIKAQTSLFFTNFSMIITFLTKNEFSASF